MSRTKPISSDAVHLEPTDAESRFSKGDASDPRLGDVLTYAEKNLTLSQLKASLASQSKDTVTIVGYPDDDGIKANGGRLGAKLGPSRVRHFFSRMTPPAFQVSKLIPPLLDLGNIPVSDATELETRHELARCVAQAAHQHGARTFSCGGGHDYGFPDAAAFCETSLARGARPLVINFDAHLDVRPLDKGLTSGTPFFRLLEEFSDIDFHELGLQSQCNSRTHVDWLKSRGGHITFEEERHAAGETLSQALKRQLGPLNGVRRSTFLSIDIDAFSSAIAPGASQSWPTGFQADDFFNCFSWCLRNLDVRGVGVYEVSPAFDVDDRTARLAALIAHRFVFQL